MTFPMPTFMPADLILPFSQVESAYSTASTITWPSVQAGDLAILFDYAADGSIPTAVTPSGFTNVLNGTNAVSDRLMGSFKICTGSESGSLAGMTGSLIRKAMVVFRRGPSFASGAGGATGHTPTTNSDPASATILSGSDTAPLVVVAFYRATTAVDPRTFTVGGSPAKDGEVSFDTNALWIAWKYYESSPSDVVIDMDDEGSLNQIGGFVVELS